MKQVTRITFDPNVMGGKPCIRGLRVTVGTIVRLFASGHSQEEILKLYPYLYNEDLREALVYHALRTEELGLLSEQSLAEDWNRPEEDEAWSYLQE